MSYYHYTSPLSWTPKTERRWERKKGRVDIRCGSAERTGQERRRAYPHNWVDRREDRHCSLKTRNRLSSLLQGRGPLPRCQSHPESRHYSWVMIMALAPTHMHSTNIRPLITKYKHHGSHADYRALWTHAFKALPHIDIPNNYQAISKRRPTKRNRDQSTDAWHTHAPNGQTITDSPCEWSGWRLQR
jgi:hypothetical protein